MTWRVRISPLNHSEVTVPLEDRVDRVDLSRDDGSSVWRVRRSPLNHYKVTAAPRKDHRGEDTTCRDDVSCKDLAS